MTPASRKPTSKKKPVKKALKKKPAKRASAKKPPMKKKPARKAMKKKPARKAQKKKPAKRASAKKPPAKKPTPRRLPAAKPAGSKKKIVVFGAGLVSRPLVRYLMDHDFEVTVASRTVSKAEALIMGHRNGRALAFDVDNEAALRALVATADLAVSLLPAPRHPEVARACLDAGKHMVTTSYVSPAMRALDAEARRRGLTLLNEIGVDPGIDHMSAMEVIHREEAAGGTLVGFTSWCGGLPAPEANNNPFGYKFSWSPRGVLVAARNSARYLKDGSLVEIPPDDLFAEPARVEIPGIGVYEGYPNRDSVSYLDVYGFDRAKVRTIMRGTLRNQGHCRLYRQIIRLGLLEAQPEHDTGGLSWRGLTEREFGVPLELTIPARLGVPATESPLGALEFIGLLADEPVHIPRASWLDLMADRMSKTMVFAPGERDMLIMRHDITFEYDRGKRRETVTAILADFGIPHGDSSMARTVSLPAAIGARMILEGAITARGVHIPIDPVIYQPVLAELQVLGIEFKESRTRD